MAHKGKKDAQDVETKRKQDVREAVEPAVTAYEEAKKALRKATIERRAAVKTANDPPPSVRVTHDGYSIPRSRHSKQSCHMTLQ